MRTLPQKPQDSHITQHQSFKEAFGPDYAKKRLPTLPSY